MEKKNKQTSGKINNHPHYTALAEVNSQFSCTDQKADSWTHTDHIRQRFLGYKTALAVTNEHLYNLWTTEIYMDRFWVSGEMYLYRRERHLYLINILLFTWWLSWALAEQHPTIWSSSGGIRLYKTAVGSIKMALSLVRGRPITRP